MEVKIFEVRDEGTMFAVLAIDMNPAGQFLGTQRYYLRRVGYPCDGRPNIAITHLSCSGGKCWNDPFGWNDRTYKVAHNHILAHWEYLKDGDVVDVSFILGETETKKTSERYNDKPAKPAE